MDFSAKDEGLGARAQTRVRRRMFLVFPIMVGGVSCDEVNDKKYILSCCLNEVFGEVRSTSVSFAINLCAQSMSYQNQHSLSQPFWNLLFFLLFFPSRFVSLLLVFSLNCLGSLLFLTGGFVSLGKYAAVCFLLLCEHTIFHLPYQREKNKPFSEV